MRHLRRKHDHVSTERVCPGMGIPNLYRLMRRQPLAEEFYAAFTSKGRMAEVLADIPAQVILNPKVALLGAARIGMERLSGSAPEQWQTRQRDLVRGGRGGYVERLRRLAKINCPFGQCRGVSL